MRRGAPARGTPLVPARPGLSGAPRRRSRPGCARAAAARRGRRPRRGRCHAPRARRPCCRRPCRALPEIATRLPPQMSSQHRSVSGCDTALYHVGRWRGVSPVLSSRTAVPVACRGCCMLCHRRIAPGFWAEPCPRPPPCRPRPPPPPRGPPGGGTPPLACPAPAGRAVPQASHSAASRASHSAHATNSASWPGGIAARRNLGGPAACQV